MNAAVTFQIGFEWKCTGDSREIYVCRCLGKLLLNADWGYQGQWHWPLFLKSNFQLCFAAKGNSCFTNTSCSNLCFVLLSDQSNQSMSHAASPRPFKKGNRRISPKNNDIEEDCGPRVTLSTTVLHNLQPISGLNIQPMPNMNMQQTPKLHYSSDISERFSAIAAIHNAGYRAPRAAAAAIHVRGSADAASCALYATTAAASAATILHLKL